jgi:hypothetical protein
MPERRTTTGRAGRAALRATTGLVACLALSACSRQAENTPAAGACRGPAADLVDRFNDQVQRTLLPGLTEAEPQELIAAAQRLARQELASQRDVLRRHAQWALDQLPAWEQFDRERYEPVDAEAQARLDEFLAGLAESGDAEGVLGGALTQGWNPVVMAAMARSLALGRLLDSTALARRSTLDAIAPPRMRKLGGNVDAPRLALIGGPELFLVELRLVDPPGLYLPARVEWLRER